jgi:hypothetical protein
MTRRLARIFGAPQIVAIALVCTMASAQGELAPDAIDGALLMRDAQLADWLGEPLAPATSICIQSRLGADWPRGGALSEREEDRLRLLRESCAAPAPGGDNSGRDRGLVVSASNDFLARVERLSGLHKAVRECAAASSDKAQQGECLTHVVAQPLTGEQAQNLLAASAARSTPSASQH